MSTLPTTLISGDDFANDLAGVQAEKRARLEGNGVRSAVSNARDSYRRKKAGGGPTPNLVMTEEAREQLRLKREAQAKQRSYFEAFDPELTTVGVDSEGRTTCMLLDPITKTPISKSIVSFEFPLMLVSAGSHSNKDGNAGMGDWKTPRTQAKRSWGLKPGWDIENAQVPPLYAARQEMAIKKAIATGERLCGLWFDTTLEKDLQVMYGSLLTSARDVIAVTGGHGSGAAVMAKSQGQSPEAQALKAQVLALARANFIAACDIPFRPMPDKDGRVSTERVAYIQESPWKNPTQKSKKEDGPKGPAVALVPTTNENMPRLIKEMAAIGFKWVQTKYILGSVPEDHPERKIEYPVVMVPDLDIFGEKIIDEKTKKPKMVRVDDVNFDPCLKQGDTPVWSMVIMKALFALKTGGSGGKPGIKLHKIDDVVIHRQARRSVSSFMPQEEGISTGLFKPEAPVGYRPDLDDGAGDDLGDNAGAAEDPAKKDGANGTTATTSTSTSTSTTTTQPAPTLDQTQQQQPASTLAPPTQQPAATGPQSINGQPPPVPRTSTNPIAQPALRTAQQLPQIVAAAAVPADTDDTWGS